jgi:hypothetical protein
LLGALCIHVEAGTLLHHAKPARFLIYVMSAGTGEEREIFVFPIDVFCELIEKAITRKSKKLGTKKAMYISRSLADKGRWYLRTGGERMA